MTLLLVNFVLSGLISGFSVCHTGAEKIKKPNKSFITTRLGGGFKCFKSFFVFTPNLGAIPFDEHIFSKWVGSTTNQEKKFCIEFRGRVLDLHDWLR